MRAFLQRSEVRLSTVHRVASALLSGAGLMVLLPAVERDSVVVVLRPLLTGRLDVARLLLAAATVASLAMPFTALWLVLRDLTRFYFHANHIGHGASEVFAPRFTLTGLQHPGDDLSGSTAVALADARNRRRARELLIPGNDAARRRIDAQIDAYGGLGTGPDRTDADRASALYTLAASKSRSLVDEVAKVEHGLVRHVLSIQVIVLRYAKALLALLATALSAFACATVVEGKPSLTPGDEAWLGAILLLWAPLAIVAVTSPVRWLESQLRNDGPGRAAATHDPELTLVEVVTVRLALAGYVAAGAATTLVSMGGGLRASGRVILAVVALTSLVAVFAAIRAAGKRLSLRRILSLHR